MKSQHICIITAIWVSGLCLGINYNIPYTAAPPTIDGVFSEAKWDGALVISMVHPDIVTPPKQGTIHPDTDDPNSPEDLSATWYLMWDEEALYIGCYVLDDEHHWLADSGSFSQDGVQPHFNFLNQYGDPYYYQYEAAVYDLAPRTASGTEPVLYKRHGELYALPNAEIGSTVWPDEAYYVEVKFPWSDFDDAYEPVAGDVHGLGLVVLDYDGPTITSPGSTIMTDFGQGQYTVADPGTWNTMTLVDELTCGDWGYLPADLNQDCVVNLLDVAILAEYWLVSH